MAKKREKPADFGIPFKKTLERIMAVTDEGYRDEVKTALLYLCTMTNIQGKIDASKELWEKTEQIFEERRNA